MKRYSTYLFGFLSLVLCAFMLVPSTAYASGLSIESVNIHAKVQNNGDMLVTEERTFDFSKSYNGVYWLLPVGDSYKNVDIKSASLVKDGSVQNFTLSTSAKNGDDGYYSVKQSDNNKTKVFDVKLFHPVDDEVATYRLVYTIKGAVTRWEDTGELYWKFVSDGWDEPSQNVTCTIELPVDAGSDTMQDILVWGHGNLEGEVKRTNSGCTITVPIVGESDFAEVRMLFPASWLSNMPEVKENKKQEVLEQENAWAQEANARREQARTILGIAVAVFGVAGIASLVVLIRIHRKYKKSHVPSFTGTYWRDVPSDDHPAVWSYLLLNEAGCMDGFKASLVRLTQISNIALESMSSSKLGVLKKKSYKLVGVHSGAFDEAGVHQADINTVDRATLEFLCWIANSIGDAHEVAFTDISKVAKKHPQQYQDHYNVWKDAVIQAIDEKGYRNDPYPPQRGGTALVLALSITFVVLTIGLMVLFDPTSGWWLSTMQACLVLEFINIAYGLHCYSVFEQYSPEALDVIAKTKALKKWLKEFTRLEEAIPTDVVLWNNLMVAAVALGIVEEVAKNLEVALPSILEEQEGLSLWYLWWYMWVVDSGNRTPLQGIESATKSAYSSSIGKLASSSNSSGSGFGGGFSSGGGGGFGGGGGGGGF